MRRVRVVVWVPLLSAVIAAVVSFVTGLVLARYRADVDANAQYELEARKRLYEAVGPLRYQLLVACREAASRIEQVSHRPFKMDTAEYYGRNTMYRLLRPLALAELIQRQTNYVDFSLDPGVLRIVRFEAGAFTALTGEEPFAEPTRAPSLGTGEQRELKLDWAKETQHVFKGRLQRAAATLIVDAPARCARIGEFEEAMDNILRDDRSAGGLRSLACLVESLWPIPKPGQRYVFAPTTDAAVFWVRLVSYGYVCNWFLSHDGAKVDIGPVPYPLPELIRRTGSSVVHPLANSLAGVLDQILGSK